MRALLKADKVARQDWLEVETADGQPYSLLPSDVAAVEDLDPEAERSKSCTSLIDLEIAGVAVTDPLLQGRSRRGPRRQRASGAGRSGRQAREPRSPHRK